VKSFFFDGVPKPNELIKTDSLESQTKKDTANQVLLADRSKLVKKGSHHKPFLERNCLVCHNKNNFGLIVNDLHELCSNCHSDFKNNFNVMHGPVSSGYCTSCHSPHKSQYQKLLLVESENLCFQCHVEEEVQSSKFHKRNKEQKCMDCHNPHGGSERFFLNEGSCTNCHENIIGSNTVIHGPVSSGLCTVCHEPHGSASTRSKINTGNTLCFDCHDRNYLLKTKTHDLTQNDRCISCHNPHSSNKQFMLYNTISTE
jgi:predicted CXXCH cytochrome family protein